MISHLPDVPFFRDELADLHEGMQLVGSAGVLFGDYPVGWIRMIFHHRLWCAPNRQSDRWEKWVMASDLKQQIS